MGVDSDAYLKTEYDAYDIFELLKKSKKVTGLRFFIFSSYREGFRASLQFYWGGSSDRDLTISSIESSDVDEGIPKTHLSYLHFGFQETSKPIMEYILGHVGGGYLNLQDTKNLGFHYVYPFGKQVLPKGYFKKLVRLDKDPTLIQSFVNGDNKDKIRCLFS
jgi:hypothetical protein